MPVIAAIYTTRWWHDLKIMIVKVLSFSYTKQIATDAALTNAWRVYYSSLQLAASLPWRQSRAFCDSIIACHRLTKQNLTKSMLYLQSTTCPLGYVFQKKNIHKFINDFCPDWAFKGSCKQFQHKSGERHLATKRLDQTFGQLLNHSEKTFIN